MSKRHIIVGSILCMIACVSWGAMFPVAHRAFEHIHPFYFSVIRYTAVSVILVALLWWKEGFKAFRFEGRFTSLLFYGTMAFTAYNLLVFYGQQMMGEPGTIAASISESLMPMISIVLLWITSKSRPSGRIMLSVCIALVGALLVITKGDSAFVAGFGQHIVPLALILIGVIGWVFYSIGGAKFHDWSALRYSTLTCVLGTFVSFAISAAGTVAGAIPVPSVQDVFAARYEMLFMIFLPGLAALLGWNAGLKMISAINGILFINLVPITTFVMMAVQGYRISGYEVAGTALIAIALVWNSMEQRKSAARVQRWKPRLANGHLRRLKTKNEAF